MEAIDYLQFFDTAAMTNGPFKVRFSPAPCVMGQTDSTPSGETTTAEPPSPAK